MPQILRPSRAHPGVLHGRDHSPARARAPHAARPQRGIAPRRDTRSAIPAGASVNVDCELCVPAQVVADNAAAYARYDSNSLARGHVIVVPRRHVADFFDMTAEEQAAVLALLNEARGLIQTKHSPDGYNVGINIGKAAR